MYLDNPMSVAYEAAKTAHFGTHPLGNSILGTVESITALDGRPDARLLRAAIQPGQHRAGVRRQGRVGARWSSWRGPTAARWQGGVGDPADAMPFRGSASFRAILRADDQQQTVVGVCDGPPLESPDRYAAHLLATILGDHTGSRLYWTLIDPGPGRRRRAFLPGLQPGRRVLHLPELRARVRPRPTSAGSPSSTGRRCATG